MNSWSLFGKSQLPVIGDATSKDAASMAEIHTAGFERGWDAPEFERMLADGAIFAHIARLGGNGKPAGFILSRLVLDEAEILTVAVAPSARGTGLGKLLMHHHLGRLAGAGIRKIFLEVAEDNAAGLQLYKRCNFIETGRRNAYYKRSGRPAAAAILMERTLG